MLDIPTFSGEHYWVVAVVHHLSEDSVIRAHQEEGGLDIDGSSVVLVPPPYCYHCQKIWVVAHAEKCSGDPAEAKATYDMTRAAQAAEKINADDGDSWEEFWNDFNE